MSTARLVPRAIAGAALALGLLGACGGPGGGVPGRTTLSVDIEWGGSPDCVEDPTNDFDYSVCSDDGTVVVTNTGSNPTIGGVFVSAHGTTVTISGVTATTEASITSSDCSGALDPEESCTAQIHAEVHDTNLNGVTGVVDAFALNASGSHEFTHTTG